MITEQNYVRIREIAMKHFRASGALGDNPDLQNKVNRILDGFQPIYVELEKEKLLPEGMNYTIFQQVVVPHLQAAAHQLQIQTMFGH
jgi:hypothetical protein